MKTRKEIHRVVHKLIDGQWKVNTYIPDIPELKHVLDIYKGQPKVFLVTEVEIEVPVIEKKYIITESDFYEAHAHAIKLAHFPNRPFAGAMKEKLFSLAVVHES